MSPGFLYIFVYRLRKGKLNRKTQYKIDFKYLHQPATTEAVLKI